MGRKLTTKEQEFRNKHDEFHAALIEMRRKLDPDVYDSREVLKFGKKLSKITAELKKKQDVL